MTIARLIRSAISATVACATAILVGCGGSLTAPSTATAQSGVTSAHNDASGCPLKRCVIVTRENGYGGKPHAVLFFARDVNGNASPIAEISGSKTMLAFPTGLAMDSQGNIYVANWGANTITVYAAGSEGNVTPIRTIGGPKTKLYRPDGIAIDSQGQLYVAGDQRNRITIYASDANGNAAPIREIRGKKTQLYAPWGLAFDSQSNLYVSNDDANNGWITVYAPDAHGNVAPQRVIKGSATKLVGPEGVDVDASGYIYVVNMTTRAVCIFAPDANGNEAPISYFNSILYAPAAITLDERQNIYVTDVGYDDPPFVAVFGAGVNGNRGNLLRTIEGSKTKLNAPQGILVR